MQLHGAGADAASAFERWLLRMHWDVRVNTAVDEAFEKRWTPIPDGCWPGVVLIKDNETPELRWPTPRWLSLSDWEQAIEAWNDFVDELITLLPDAGALPAAEVLSRLALEFLITIIHLGEHRRRPPQRPQKRLATWRELGARLSQSKAQSGKYTGARAQWFLAWVERVPILAAPEYSLGVEVCGAILNGLQWTREVEQKKQRQLEESLCARFGYLGRSVEVTHQALKDSVSQCETALQKFDAQPSKEFQVQQLASKREENLKQEKRRHEHAVAQVANGFDAKMSSLKRSRDRNESEANRLKGDRRRYEVQSSELRKKQPEEMVVDRLIANKNRINAWKSQEDKLRKQAEEETRTYEGLVLRRDDYISDRTHELEEQHTERLKDLERNHINNINALDRKHAKLAEQRSNACASLKNAQDKLTRFELELNEFNTGHAERKLRRNAQRIANLLAANPLLDDARARVWLNDIDRANPNHPWVQYFGPLPSDDHADIEIAP